MLHGPLTPAHADIAHVSILNCNTQMPPCHIALEASDKMHIRFASSLERLAISRTSLALGARTGKHQRRPAEQQLTDHENPAVAGLSHRFHTAASPPTRFTHSSFGIASTRGGTSFREGGCQDAGPDLSMSSAVTPAAKSDCWRRMCTHSRNSVRRHCPRSCRMPCRSSRRDSFWERGEPLQTQPPKAALRGSSAVLWCSAGGGTPKGTADQQVTRALRNSASARITDSGGGRWVLSLPQSRGVSLQLADSQQHHRGHKRDTSRAS